MVKLVKMVRETPLHVDGPTSADVHPDHVSGRMRRGWSVVEQKEEVKTGSNKSRKKKPEPSDEDLV